MPPINKPKIRNEGHPRPDITGEVQIEVRLSVTSRMLTFTWFQKGGVIEFKLDPEGTWGGPWKYSIVNMEPQVPLTRDSIRDTGLTNTLNMAASDARYRIIFDGDTVEALEKKIGKAPLDKYAKSKGENR